MEGAAKPENKENENAVDTKDKEATFGDDGADFFEDINFDNVMAERGDEVKGNPAEDKKPTGKPPLPTTAKSGVRVVEPAMASAEAGTEDTVSTAIQENVKLKRAAQKERKVAEDLRKKVQELEESMKALEEKNEELLTAKLAAENKAEDFEGKYNRAKEDATSGAAGRDEAIKELEQKLEESVAKTLKAEEERDTAVASVDRLKDELTSVKGNLSQLIKEKQESSGATEKSADMVREEERKKAAVEFDKLKKKATVTFNNLRAQLTKARTEKASLDQKMARARQIHVQMKRAEKQNKTTIEKLEKELAVTKATRTKTESDAKAQKEAFEKEKKENKEKLANADKLAAQVEVLTKEKDEWTSTISDLKATVSFVQPLSTAARVTVSFSGMAEDLFAVQWFRCGSDGLFRVIEGAQKARYHTNCDDLGCVLKVTCTRIEDGFQASAFTGRVVPHPKLTPYVRNILVHNAGVLELLSRPNAPRKLILLNGKKMKIRHGKETKQKAEFNQDMKILLDYKSANMFSLAFNKKSMPMQLAAKTPFDRDTIVMTVRAFNELHLYKERQAKLPKKERDMYTAPLRDVLMAIAGGLKEGESEEAHRQSMLSRSHSRRALSREDKSKGGVKTTGSTGTATGVVAPPVKDDAAVKSVAGDVDDPNKKGEDTTSATAATKKKKDYGGINLNKYMNKDKDADDFWSDSDEEEQKKLTVKIMTEAEAQKEKEEKEKKRQAAQQSSNGVSSPASALGGLGTPGGLGAPTGRRRQRKSVSDSTTKKGKKKNKGKKGRSRSRTASSASAATPGSTATDDVSTPASSRSAGAATAAATTTTTTTTTTTSVENNFLTTKGVDTKKKKREIEKKTTTGDDNGEALAVTAAEEKKEKQGRGGGGGPVDPLDLFFSVSPASTPTNKSPASHNNYNNSSSNGVFKIVVSEAIDYTVKDMKVVKIGELSGEVTILRSKSDTGVAQNVSVKLLGKDGNVLKTSSFKTPFLERGKGCVDCTLPIGQASVFALSYSTGEMDSRRIPFLAKGLWKTQGNQTQAAVMWYTNPDSVTKPSDTVFSLKLRNAVEQCLGKSSLYDKASKSFKWNAQQATYDPSLQTLTWKEKLKGSLQGKQVAMIKVENGVSATPITVSLQCPAASTSLSGASLVDARGSRIQVSYDFKVNVQILP